MTIVAKKTTTWGESGFPSEFLDNRMAQATRLPMTVGILVLGLYLSITLVLDLGARAQSVLDTGAGVLGLLLGIVAAASAVSQMFGWYIDSVAASASSRASIRMLPLLRRITSAMIYGVGALLIMGLLPININPLIASLGLGGLAVALAIQPTLANLFAGTYVMTEGIIRPGDYIELEGGVAGYVVEVSWRSTRLRTWGNNLVVVPNAKFAETIITNYNEPRPAVNVYLTCGVSYDSDLDLVENVSFEVMREELETHPNALTGIPQIKPPFLDIAPAGIPPNIIPHSKGVKCGLMRPDSLKVPAFIGQPLYCQA